MILYKYVCQGRGCHKDDIGLTKDDPINFCQAMRSSNSKLDQFHEG